MITLYHPNQAILVVNQKDVTKPIHPKKYGTFKGTLILNGVTRDWDENTPLSFSFATEEPDSLIAVDFLITGDTSLQFSIKEFSRNPTDSAIQWRKLSAPSVRTQLEIMNIDSKSRKNEMTLYCVDNEGVEYKWDPMISISRSGGNGGDTETTLISAAIDA